jgi:tetratricopeptide (TPR) repeat protein
MKIYGLLGLHLALLITLMSHAQAADVSAWCPDGQKTFKAGKFDEANLALSSCLYNPPEDPVLASEGYYLRGETYFERLDYQAALSDFDLAVELWPENAEAWRSKAWLHYKQDDFLPSIQSITRALEVNPHSTKSNYVHASILTAMDRPGAAMDAYDLAYSFESRETVKKLQQELDNQGFSVGSIDGVYGAQTRKALKACIADKCILSM